MSGWGGRAWGLGQGPLQNPWVSLGPQVPRACEAGGGGGWVAQVLRGPKGL